MDDLRPDIAAFGATHVHSPAMDALALSGRAFHRHYVQAPTCGASRYALLTGRYPTPPSRRGNDAIFRYAAKHADESPSLPEHLRKNGYRTISIGKISHHPGGLGGNRWNDEKKPELPEAWDHIEMPTPPWKDPITAMHGYAKGKGRERGTSPAIEHVDGDDMAYTDGWIAEAAERELTTLARAKKPFFLAVGLMKPHLPFACPAKYREHYNDTPLPPISHPAKPAYRSTWHASGEFKQYHYAGRDPNIDSAYADELRRSYAACVSYADAQIGKIMARLDSLGLTDSTIVILWGDHGYHLGEHGVWGKHTLFEESLRAPLIIRHSTMPQAGVASQSIVETVDIYPTISALCGIPAPDSIDGQNLMPLLQDPLAEGRPAVAFSPASETIRTDSHRLIRSRRGTEKFHHELYDHRDPARETRNIADEHPELVQKLSADIDLRLKSNPKR